MARLEGTLERKGKLWRWAPVRAVLDDDTLTVREGSKEPEIVKVHNIDVVSRSELTFIVVFEVASSGLVKKGVKEKQWHLKAGTSDQYDKWCMLLTNCVKRRITGSPDGYPDTDPMSGLPLVNISADFKEQFAFLKRSVVHWFGVVKILTADFGTAEHVLILCHDYIYLCMFNSSVMRCIGITEVIKIIVAQDAKKDLYIIMTLPNKLPHPKFGDCPEFDLMVHNLDIRNFVRYARTLYIHQTRAGNNERMLELEQLRDKDQLEKEIKLGKPDGWHLNHREPFTKLSYMKELNKWNSLSSEEKKAEEQWRDNVWQSMAKEGGQAPAPAPPVPESMKQKDDDESDEEEKGAFGGGDVEAKVEATAAESEEDDDDDDDDASVASLPEGADEDPFGRLLKSVNLAQYYVPLAVDNNVTLDVFASGLLDDRDFLHFGVKNKAHRVKLLKVAGNEKIIQAAREARPAIGGAKKKKKGGKEEDVADDLLDDDSDSLSLGDGGVGGAVDDDDGLDDLLADDSGPASPKLAALEEKEDESREEILSNETVSRKDLAFAHSEFAPCAEACDASVPLGRFLTGVGLPQYFGFLHSKDITLETLACGLIDNASLKLFGIENGDHRAQILKGLEDPTLVGDDGLEWITTTEDPKKALEKDEAQMRKDTAAAEKTARDLLLTRHKDEMPKVVDIGTATPLARFLKAIHLEKYHHTMADRDMTLEVMTSGLFDDDDLRNHCDITEMKDRKKIKAALDDKKLIDAVNKGVVDDWSLAGAAQNSLLKANKKIQVCTS